MKSKKQLQEEHLDELLNQFFLDENAPEVSEDFSSFIFAQAYEGKMDLLKEKKLIDKLNRKLRGPGNYLSFWVIIFAVLLVGLGMLFYENKAVLNSEPLEKRIPVNDLSKNTQPFVIPRSSISFSSKKVLVIHADDTINVHNSNHKKIETDMHFNMNDISIYFPYSGVGSKSSSTFFKPSARDLAFYAMVKNKMLERIVNLDKELYTFIESGEITYHDQSITLNSFTIRKQTISNLEYKIFLTDLLKSGKKDVFKKAVVRNEAWVNYTNNILANTYFFDKKYNDYPVVNISPEAAILFCEWLENEINLFYRHPNEAAFSFTVRLPFDTEYYLAAIEGVVQFPSGIGYKPICGSKDGVLSIDDLKGIPHFEMQNKNKKSDLDNLFSIDRYAMNENETLQLFEKGFTDSPTTLSDTLYPNKMEPYSKIGHVSEIVLQQKTRSTLVVGSCWKNKNQYKKMVKEFNQLSASPFVGFRIVINRSGTEKYAP